MQRHYILFMYVRENVILLTQNLIFYLEFLFLSLMF